jgi:ribosomal protein S12 methylthiotransferase
MPQPHPTSRPVVALLSLGCAKNLVDSEHIASVLEAHGVDVVHDAGVAPVAIVNTCGFIESAREESIDTILDAGARKGPGGLSTLIVTGCMGQRYGDELADLIPEADVVLGIDADGAARAALEALGLPVPQLLSGPSVRRHRLTPSAWAYLRVADGCDNRCAYCSIPQIRGPLRSRPMEEVLEEARYLADAGVREINVIAQDTTNYGIDVYGRRRIHELLESLCGIDGFRWVRLLYCHPAHVSDELIELMGSEEKICPYVDLPLQHISDRMLAAMGRHIGRSETEALLGRLRDRVPGLALRTTFITGFPGETQADFEELLEFVREARFDRCGCFPYSSEEGTRAAGMREQVAPETAQERADMLMEAQQEIAFDLAAKREGECTTVLLEGDDDGEFRTSRSPKEAPDVDPVVLIPSDQAGAGPFCRVRIVGAIGYDCVAEVLEENCVEG